jgi:hypothetical protein
MSGTQKETTKTVQDLIARTLKRQVSTAQRFSDLLVRFGRGEISAQDMTQETIRFASQETGHYASDLAELSMRYYSDLLTIQQDYSERFFHSLEEKGKGHPEGGSEADRSGTAAKRVEMEMRAPLGQEAIRAFVLENKRGGSARISFEVSDFHGPVGTEPFQGGLRLQPDMFTLEPGQEQVVTLRLQLREELFNAGKCYTTSVIVHGYDQLEVALTVCVDEKV